MSNFSFLRDPSGRLANTTLGVALVGLGVVSFFPTAPIGLIACLILAMIGAMIVTVGLTTLAHPAHAVGLLIGVPPVAGVYLFLALSVPGSGAVVGALFLLLGALPLAAAISPSIVPIRAQPAAEISTQEPARAHA